MKKLLIILLVLVVLIISGCEELTTIKDDLKEGVKEAKIKGGEEIKSINSALKSCEGKAKELVPKYFIFSETEEVQIGNYWKDDEPMSFNQKESLIGRYKNCLRKGENEGENINLFYLTNEKGCPTSFGYSKKIIDKDGLVLGTKQFNIMPIALKEADIGFDIKLIDKKTSNSGFSFKGFEWFGFNKEIKKLFGADEIKISLKKVFGNELVHEESHTDEDKEITFDITVGYDSNSYPFYTMKQFRLDITPDIIRNKVYEIEGYEITDCNWIEEE